MNITCQYIGHATTLIKIGQTCFLTDPNFSNRVLFFKRQVKLTPAPNELPKIDTILISHVHFDHLDFNSYKYISVNVPIIVPESCYKLLAKYLPNPVTELGLFATHNLRDGSKITAVTARHRGGRLSHLRYTTTNSYLIQKDGCTVFFCGDSGYGPHFKEIANLAKIDLALLPIANYEPQWFMKTRHMKPGEAVQAFEDLKAKWMIPIHWGTFKLSAEPLNQPLKLLDKIIAERPSLKDKIHILPHGQEITLRPKPTS
ncbi:MAG: MBL fold metallo-hydrolase [Pseudomonadota bacterium]